MSNIAEEITKKRNELSEIMYAALTKFTNETGVLVDSAEWEIATLSDMRGCLADATYWNFRLNLKLQ